MRDPQEDMGHYEVLSDTRTPECSLRLLRLSHGHRVSPHCHKNTTQIYVILEGIAQVVIQDTRSSLRPYETVRVPSMPAGRWPGTEQ